MADRAGDAELLAAIPTDEAAFEAFYVRYFERVTAFAVRRCSCAADVADVVAQTFVRLLSAAPRYDPARAQPAAFVFGITANVVHELHRSGLGVVRSSRSSPDGSCSTTTTSNGSRQPSTRPGPLARPTALWARCHPANAWCSSSLLTAAHRARQLASWASHRERRGPGCRGLDDACGIW